MERQGQSMSKLKTAAVIFVTALLVTAGAFLPMAFSKIVHQEQKILYENIEPLKLEKEEEEQKRKSVTEKLSILRQDGQTVFVDENLMASTKEEIYSSVEEYVQRCVDAGVVPVDSVIGDWVKIVPCLIFDYSDGESHDLFWNINVNLESAEGIIGIFGIMDDATRHMYRFSINDYIGEAYGTYMPVADKTELFAAFFFQELGIAPEKMPEEDASMTRYRLDVGDGYGLFFEFYNYGNGINLYIA